MTQTYLNVTRSLRAALITPALVGTLLASACAAPEAPISSVEESSFSLDLAGPRPMVMASFSGGAPVKLMFDTGLSGLLLDKAFAEAEGLPNLGPVTATGLTGNAAGAYRTRVPSFSLGTVVLRDVPAVVSALPVTGAANPRVGVVGTDIFGDVVARIDLAIGEVTIRPRDEARLPEGRATPYIMSSRFPGIEVTFSNGASVTALFDTGAPTALTLPLDAAAALPLDEPPQAGEMMRGLDGGSRQTWRARASGPVLVGPLEREDLAVSFTEGLPVPIAGIESLRGLILVVDTAGKLGWVCSAAEAHDCRLER